MSQESWVTLTHRVMLCAIVLLVLYNVTARVCGGTEATISFQIYELSQKWPIIAALIGFLVGHWLWPIK